MRGRIPILPDEKGRIGILPHRTSREGKVSYFFGYYANAAPLQAASMDINVLPIRKEKNHGRG
jgi:hypothetical protein